VLFSVPPPLNCFPSILSLNMYDPLLLITRGGGHCNHGCIRDLQARYMQHFLILLRSWNRKKIKNKRASRFLWLKLSSCCRPCCCFSGSILNYRACLSSWGNNTATDNGRWPFHSLPLLPLPVGFRRTSVERLSKRQWSTDRKTNNWNASSVNTGL
jgi:hypothetical protein